MATMEDRILKVLAAAKKGAAPKELQKRISARKAQREEYRRALHHLLDDYQVMEHKGRYYLTGQLGLTRCEIVKVNGTFGFAKDLASDKEVFVPGRDLLGSLPGDIVLLKISKGNGQLPEGKVYQITSPANITFSGVLEQTEQGWAVVPDKYVRFPLMLHPGTEKGLQPGDKVLAKLERRGRRHSEHIAAIVESFGSAQSAAACSKAILAAAGIPTEFPEEVLEQARVIAGAGIHPKELASRLDLREDIIFTIDGADSKDLDDAISLQSTDQGWRLGVHIADVSYYVTHNSPLDQEALARGTSVYYADSVIPMLPKELSNGICSLNPGEDRLAFSALLEIDPSGNLLSYRFIKTVIRSRVKGIYSEVNAVLEDSADPDIRQKYREMEPMLQEMKSLAELLGRNRFARGGMDLESVESKIVIGQDGRAMDVKARERGESERIIEEFMLMANQAAASFALEQKIPFVYRVHEPPAPDKLEELAKVLETLGISYQRKAGRFLPNQLNSLLQEVKGKELATVVNNMVLRSMAKAKYADRNIGHFGLALDNYAHFTSPIRRYPDLTIHRILSGFVTGMRPENIHKRFESFAARSALQSTQREIAAMTAERDCEDCFKAEYMQRFLGQKLEGIVSSVANFGVYVQLPNTVEGLVHQRDLPAGDWGTDGQIAFTERITGRQLRLGDPVAVKVTAVDISAGKVDFVLAE